MRDSYFSELPLRFHRRRYTTLLHPNDLQSQSWNFSKQMQYYANPENIPDELCQQLDYMHDPYVEANDSFLVVTYHISDIVFIHFVPLSHKVRPKTSYPETSRELEQQLLRVLLQKQVPSLSRLIMFHDTFPNLHSTRSYNYLIQICLRHLAFRTVKRLFGRMHTNNIQPDTKTRTLFVRWMVRTGQISQAWHTVRSKMVRDKVRPPLPVLLEFLDDTQVGAFSPEKNISARSAPNYASSYEATSSRPEIANIHEQVLSIILSGPSEDRNSEVVLYAIVGLLLRAGRGNIARRLTKKWITSLAIGENLPESRLQRYLSALHLHLRYANPRRLRDHFKARRLVMRCLEIGNIRPTATTLYLFLRSIKGLGRARALISSMKNKWGDAVVDQRVRRQLVGLKLRSGRLVSVMKAFEYEALVRERERGRTMETSMLGSKADIADNQSKPSNRQQGRKGIIYPGTGKERIRWKVLRLNFIRRLKESKSKVAV